MNLNFRDYLGLTTEEVLEKLKKDLKLKDTVKEVRERKSNNG